MSEENLEVVRRANELYLRGELDRAIEECMALDIEWGTRWLGLASMFHGHEGVRQWAAQVNESMEFRDELLDVRALDDERVLAHYELSGRGRGSGVPTAMKHFDLLWLRDGFIYKRQTFPSEEEAPEAAGLRG
jgi:hypothetical protein